MKTSLCTVAFAVPGFRRDWNHCDQIADYLATATSIDNPESFRYGNLLSLIINEILETIYLSDKPTSTVEVELLTEPPFVYIAMHLDPADRVVTFYSKIIEQTAEGGALELYQARLSSKDSHPDLGILGIVTHYQAGITVLEATPGRSTIEVSVALDRFLEVAQ